MAGALVAAVSERLDAPLLSLSADEVTAELREDFSCIQQLSSRLLGLVQQASTLEIPSAHAATSPQMWLAELLGVSMKTAYGWTRLAERLPSMDAVSEALAAGTVNVEQAQVIASTVADLPREVGPEGKAKAAAVLTGIAAEDRVRPENLFRHKAMIMEMVAPEIAEERLRKALERAERNAYERRGLTLSPDGDGGYRVRGLLDADAAAFVRAALDPISAPGSLSGWTHRHGIHEDSDSREDSGDHGGPTHECSDRNVARSSLCRDHGSIEDHHDGCVDDGRIDQLVPDDTTRDTRTAAARRADALTFLCQRALDDGELPESGGEKAHLVVTLSWEQLRDRVGHGLLDTGDLLTPAVVRRLACDAQIIPAVLNGAGQVLDVGRARRLIDGPLRRALVLRDKGCTWPGCDRPARWCDGHHVVPWHDGGPTSLANSALLCGYHHREIHKGQWTIRMSQADGRPEFFPPPFLDPLQRPRRNLIHHRT